MILEVTIFFYLITFHTLCFVLINLVGTQKLAFKYHSDFAKLTAIPFTPSLNLQTLKRKREQGPEMKVPGDFRKIKNKSLGASGLTPLAIRGFEVLGHTVNCQSQD